ncbi:uncharacterized protein N7518_004249 [Penicillium psychrosexuale]|uniref:uncharacterized protein n=1 Tax=Penicillium psychrosexuale TaxID=1002107 RepID=UPI002545BD4B|nr:uncharacterized protein N7518_004249 [Penicillium psychrosexuale]KAJ5795709.1 hypothetical protein N7518_004249 [Penicillium psychrosexuale]
MRHNLRTISSLVRLSHCDIEDFEFDYGLDEDEGEPSLAYQPPALEVVESLHRKADSLHHGDFNLQSPSEGSVVITSHPTTTSPEPDLRYIIHIAFPHKQLGLELMPIAQAFTAAIIDNIPRGKTISFEFFSASQSLGAILASHRDLIKSRPEVAIGAVHQDGRTFPQDRMQNYIPGVREPYRSFFVTLDRPDFLTEPGVLFFLTDGNQITDEAIQNISNLCGPKDERGDYAVYQVWRSTGMAEVAQ